jgi:phage-related holin
MNHEIKQKKTLYMRFLEEMNYLVQGFGFSSTADFAESTFHVSKNWWAISFLSMVMGSLAWFVETYIGMTPAVYLAFIVLLAIEFVTGIQASLKSGQKIQSRKFGRMIVKIGVYTCIIGLIHTFKGMGGEIPIYFWIYYTLFNMVVVQMLISVLENLSKLGYADSTLFLRVIKNKLNKWFDLEQPEDRG